MARARPDTFVIGLDPATDTLAHAGRRVARDRVPNVMLLVGDVETVSRELAGVADEARVHFPWGSLLRGVMGEDPGVLDAIARLPRPGGSLTLLLSLVTRDGLVAVQIDDLDRLAVHYAERSMTLIEARQLTKRDVREAGSSWGKRLDAGGKRPGVYLRFVRDRASHAEQAEQAGHW